jgi:hypothetical protein
LPDLFGQSSINAFIQTFRLQFIPLDHPDKPGDDSSRRVMTRFSTKWASFRVQNGLELSNYF